MTEAECRHVHGLCLLAHAQTRQSARPGLHGGSAEVCNSKLRCSVLLKLFSCLYDTGWSPPREAKHSDGCANGARQ